MASYIVLARKWRPQTFSDLVGQQHVATTLRNAIRQNRVAHAFLFTGSRGVGKTSSARIFAKALNCEHAPCDEPCNACHSCIEITEGHSLDVIEIDGASNRGINEIREVLDAVRYAPSRDRYKIYIIDEVHMLTTEAFNALLKTLEEPPAHVIFIFATTDPNKIPITIVSRCQRYDFKRISNEDMFAHLSHIAESEHIAFDESALRLIARTARGGLRDALSAMDQIIAFAEQPITGERAAEVLGVASRETLMKMGEAVVRRDVPKVLECIGRVEHYGQNLSLFAFDLLEFLRDVTVVATASGRDVPVELDAAELAQVRAWIPMTTPDRLQRMFQIWYQTSELLPKSLSPRLVMEMAAIRMCQVETVVPIDGILRKLDAITRSLSAGTAMTPDALDHIRAYLGGIAATGALPEGDEKKKLDPNPVDVIPVAQTLQERTPQERTPHSERPAPTTPPAPPTPRPIHAGIARVVPHDPFEKDDSPFQETGGNPDPEDAPWPDDPGLLQDAEYSAEEWDEGDGGGDTIDQIGQKTLAVSGDRFKNANPGAETCTERHSRWKQVVLRLQPPLSTMMARARVDAFSGSELSVVLPSVYHDIITEPQRRELERQAAQIAGQAVRVNLDFSELGNDADTLAAQEARVMIARQQETVAKAAADPMFQNICRIFGVDSDAVRFTFHNDRTNS